MPTVTKGHRRKRIWQCVRLPIALVIGGILLCLANRSTLSLDSMISSYNTIEPKRIENNTTTLVVVTERVTETDTKTETDKEMETATKTTTELSETNSSNSSFTHFLSKEFDTIIRNNSTSSLSPELKSNSTASSIQYPSDGIIPQGILSQKSQQFFDEIRSDIDNDNNTERCLRYEFTYDPSKNRKRRIFYGALIASEPWELFEIVSTETYQIFSGVIFVESNRTQNTSPRPFSRLDHGPILQRLFGVKNLQIRQFVNEDITLGGLAREHQQRAEILRGWADIGMQPEDLGLLGDTDETFTRDFLKAAQVCEIPALDYQNHNCRHGYHGVRAVSISFESSPACAVRLRRRAVFHPDIKNGYCIEQIGNQTIHPSAPREPKRQFERDWGSMQDNRTYLSNAADYRRIGNVHYGRTHQNGYDEQTGFHFHNFFASGEAIKFKYRTYGHAVPGALQKKLEDIHLDMLLVSKCAKPTRKNRRKKHPMLIVGGYNGLNLFKPIYFQDEEYRLQRQKLVEELIYEDERQIDAMLALDASQQGNISLST